jgi:hypothetical protein
MKEDSTPSEAEIRRYLAANPSALEPGLVLVKEEFPLQNPDGARGYVDLLCRDPFGHFVIVELKRSDSAARQAVHEMFKYASLLRGQYNVAPAQVRCIFASTDWHELRVPFSEYARTAGYPTRGYQLHVHDGPAGLRITATRVEPLRENSVVRFCPDHSIFLYRARESRDRAIPALKRALERGGIEGACIIQMQYTGENTRVIYPFASYLAIQEFSPAERLRRSRDLDPEELEENEWYVEERAIGSLGFDAWDTLESGSPEKLSHQMNGWEVGEIHRVGPHLQSCLLLPDEDLVSQVRGREGRNAYSLAMLASPQFEPSWNHLVEEAGYTLQGNMAWSEVILGELERVRREQPGATVSVNLFNPSDALMALVMFALKGQTGALPAFEVVVGDGSGLNTTVLWGTLSWDGRKRPKPLEPLLARIFGGSASNYFMYRTLGALWEYDDILVSMLGLHYAVHKVRKLDGEPPACSVFRYDGERFAETPEECGFDSSLLRYLEANGELLLEARSFFGERSNFLR